MYRSMKTLSRATAKGSLVVDALLPACMMIFIGMLVAVTNTKLVNNFFYLILLLPGLYMLCRGHLRPNSTALMLTTYLIYVAVSTFWGTGDGVSVLKQLKYVVYILAFMVMVHQFARSPERIQLLAGSALGLALLLEGISLYQQLSHIGLGTWLTHFPRLSQTSGPLNPVYLALAIGLFGFILITRLARTSWMSTLLVCALILACLPLQSRTLILALVVAQGYNLFQRKQFGACAAWAVACLAGAVFLLTAIDRFTSSVHRDNIWLFSLHSFWQDCSLLIGCGNRYDFDINIGGSYFYHPHSVALSQLLYGGLAGGVLLLTTLGFLYRASRQANASWRPVFVYCMTACLTIGHTILTHPDFLWLLTWLPLGLSGILFTSAERTNRVQ